MRRSTLTLMLMGFAAASCRPSTTPLPSAVPTLTLTAAPSRAPSETLPPPTLRPTPAPTGGATRIALADRMVQVYVPAGSVEGYCDRVAQECASVPVEVAAFWLDQTEVTNAQYANCVAERACSPPSSLTSSTREYYYGEPPYSDYPVIHVDWFQAAAYCAWANRRLPTEAEWRLALGPEDWGTACRLPDPHPCELRNDLGCVGDTTAVGSYPPGDSPSGALDMIGNVWEWVGAYLRVDSQGRVATVPPEDNIQRLLLGGSWRYDDIWGFPNDCHTFMSARYQSELAGFRCASDDPSS